MIKFLIFRLLLITCSAASTVETPKSIERKRASRASFDRSCASMLLQITATGSTVSLAHANFREFADVDQTPVSATAGPISLAHANVVVESATSDSRTFADVHPKPTPGAAGLGSLRVVLSQLAASWTTVLNFGAKRSVWLHRHVNETLGTLDLRVLMALTLIAYPAVFMGLLLLALLLVGLCLIEDRQHTDRPTGVLASLSGGATTHTEVALSNVHLANPQEEGDDCAFSDPETSLHEEEDEEEKDEEEEDEEEAETEFSARLRGEYLSPQRKVIFRVWAAFCSYFPALVMFGTPIILAFAAVHYKTEVRAAVGLVSSAFMLSNLAYIITYVGSGFTEIRRAPSMVNVAEARDDPWPMHWVVLPQYEEDVAVVTQTISSISQSTLARSSIGLVLAMEEREETAREKAEECKRIFGGQFAEIVITYHPFGLPNDPPGKASNVSWAFRALVKQLEHKGRAMDQMLLTVCDADSVFDSTYFECLSAKFTQTSKKTRDRRIWQSPIFHLKNYHSQPSIVLVGSIFTSLMEVATVGDPYLVRLPYSTYSLSFALARKVNGWDSEWIAEDWHMGLKCFLGTRGNTIVEMLPLPTLNYTPEANTWLGTLRARWSQASRHALGVTDISYFIMSLPIVIAAVGRRRVGGSSITGRAVSVPPTCSGRELPADSLFARASRIVVFLWRSFAIFVRLMHTHVVFGMLTCYMLLSVLADNVSLYHIAEKLRVSAGHAGIVSLGMLFCVMIAVFMMKTALDIYIFIQDRIDGRTKTASFIFRNNFLHHIYLVICFIGLSSVYFSMLGLVVIRATVCMLFYSTFDYEVAAKPLPMPVSQDESEPRAEVAGHADC